MGIFFGFKILIIIERNPTDFFFRREHCDVSNGPEKESECEIS